MDAEEHVYKSLEHIRQIHFALLLICGAVGYLTYSGWSGAIEVKEQLEQLEGFTLQLQKVSQQHDLRVIEQIDPKWVNERMAHVERSLQEIMGFPISFKDYE